MGSPTIADQTRQLRSTTHASPAGFLRAPANYRQPSHQRRRACRSHKALRRSDQPVLREVFAVRFARTVHRPALPHHRPRRRRSGGQTVALPVRSALPRPPLPTKTAPTTGATRSNTGSTPTRTAPKSSKPKSSSHPRKDRAARSAQATREAYTNALGDDRAFITVSAASNRSKEDQGLTTWPPPVAARSVHRGQRSLRSDACRPRGGRPLDGSSQRGGTSPPGPGGDQRVPGLGVTA